MTDATKVGMYDSCSLQMPLPVDEDQYMRGNSGNCGKRYDLQHSTYFLLLKKYSQSSRIR